MLSATPLSGSHCHQHDHQSCQGGDMGGPPELSPSNQLDAQAGENM